MINDKYIITRDELLDILQGKDIKNALDTFIEASQSLIHDEKLCIALGENPERKGIEGEFLATVIGKAIKNCLYGNSEDVDLMDCYKHSWCFGGDVKQQGNEKAFFFVPSYYFTRIFDNQRIWHGIIYDANKEFVDCGHYDFEVEHDFCDNPYLDICGFYSVKDDANKYFICVDNNMKDSVYSDLSDMFNLVSQKLERFTYKDVFEEDDFIENIDKYKDFLADKLVPMCESAISKLRDDYRQSDDYTRRIAMGLDVEKELNDLFEPINVYKDIVLLNGQWTIKHNADSYKILLPEDIFNSLEIKCEVKKEKERE